MTGSGAPRCRRHRPKGRTWRVLFTEETRVLISVALGDDVEANLPVDVGVLAFVFHAFCPVRVGEADGAAAPHAQELI